MPTVQVLVTGVGSSIAAQDIVPETLFFRNS